jgi:group II intron reverse transcriptase/maturase
VRERCWRHDWVIDLDISKFFDTVNHGLMGKAVAAHTDARWVLLYVERWLGAPMAGRDSELEQRTVGTPQGGLVSPVLANLFLHYAFDQWMASRFASVEWARYVDDAVVHCDSRRQAEYVLAQIVARFAEVGLKVNLDKTRIVYCKDAKRRGQAGHTSFVFLGYEFRARAAKGRRDEVFASFLPAVSHEALKRMGRQLRSMRIHHRVGLPLGGLVRWLRPILNGWLVYYGRYYPSALAAFAARVNTYIMRWAKAKYRSLRGKGRFKRWWAQITRAYPGLFPHWAWTTCIRAGW